MAWKEDQNLRQTVGAVVDLNSRIVGPEKELGWPGQDDDGKQLGRTGVFKGRIDAF
jgi:hypothetical protein